MPVLPVHSIAKYLYIISYSYNIPAVLICLVNLPLKDVSTHPLPKRHSQEFVFSMGVWKVMISDDAASSFIFQHSALHLILKEKL